MSDKTLLSIILSGKLQWNKVNAQPCIHAFHKAYYINLCLWKNNENKSVISIDVDDIEKGAHDILSLNIEEGDNKFQQFMEKYNSARLFAKNIAA